MVTAPSAESKPKLGARSVVQWALFSLPVVVFLAAGWAHRSIADDGFIYLRVVHQIGSGHGPVFNVGERVEAFTGTLWVALLTLADLVTPLRLEWLAVLLGLGLGAAGIAFAMVAARRLWSGCTGDPLFVPLGALVFVVLLPVWVFATTGLETGLAFGWLGACLWILAGWARSPDDRLSTLRAVVLGLGWLVRPELVLFSAAFFVMVLAFDWQKNGRRGCVRVALAMLALPVGYQIFRMGYYGSLFSNTAIAKEGSSTDWTRGWHYFRDFVDPYWLWVPAVALLAGGYLPLVVVARRQARVLSVAGVFVVGGALQAMYVVAVGGDYIHARLFLPALFALCAPVAAIPATRRQLASLIVVPWALAALVMLRPDQYQYGNVFANGFVMVQPGSFGKVTVDDYGWGAGGPRQRWYHGPAYYHEVGLFNYQSAEIPLANDVRLPYGAFFGVGIVSYAMGNDFHVLDVFGLADGFTAHLETRRSSSSPGLPGHEKPLPGPWIAARLTPAGSQPDARDFPNLTTTGSEFEEQVAWARAALRCDGIQHILIAADSPLTPKRFAANFLRSFNVTRTRIPPDPETAYHEFCGPGTPARVRAVRSHATQGSGAP